ncbi:MAG: PAS domain-containing protein, partial [Acidobacteriota bacterium]
MNDTRSLPTTETHDDVTALRDEVSRLRSELAAARRARRDGLFARLFEQIPIEIAVFDRDQRYLYVNPAAITDPECRRWIIGRTDYDYCRDRGLDARLADERFDGRTRAAETRRVVRCEEESTAPDGARRVVQRCHAPIFGTDG